MDIDTQLVEKVDYEEALKMTGFSRHNLYTFLICCSANLATIFETSSLSLLLLFSASELNTGTRQQELITFLTFLGVMLAAATWGTTADTKGRKTVLVMGMTMSFIAGFCATFSPHWIVFCVLKILSFIPAACGYVISQMLLSECTPMPRKRLLIMLSTTVSLIALGLMFAIHILILPLEFSHHIPILNIKFNAWRLLNLIFALPSALSAILLTRLYESPKYLLSAGRTAEALEILKAMYVRNTGKSGESYNVQVETLFLNESCMTKEPMGYFRSAWIRLMTVVRIPYKNNTCLMQWLYTFYMISALVFFLWLSSVVDIITTTVPADHPDLTFCGMLRISKSALDKPNEDCLFDSLTMIILFGICMILAVVNVVTSGLVIYVDRKKIFIAIQFLSGFALLCVNASRSQIMIGALFLIFLISLLNLGIINSYIVETYPTYIRALAACLILSTGIGQGKLIFDMVHKFLGNHCEYIIYLFGVFTCIGGLLGFLLPSDVKQKEET